MKKFFPTLAVMAAAAAAFAPLPAAAQESELRIGYVNVDFLLTRSPQYRAANSALENEFRPRDEELKKIEQNIQAAQEEIRGLQEKQESESLTTPAAERRELDAKLRDMAGELRAMQRKFKRMEEEFREDFNLRRNEERVKVEAAIRRAINEFAVEEKFDLIAARPIFASKRIDITPRIMEKLEAQHEQ
ncbi:MAG: OmpH family outer membrane protein [Gammaproteobacteria bacterium]|nr:OmpH family outer membrane protein [Gammaproteobacteria bacterium]MDD9870209.1 OmpH family outer membrane protein [Gammaproteobacteria bacterium]